MTIVISKPAPTDANNGGNSSSVDVGLGAPATNPEPTLDVTMTVPAPTQSSATNSATATASSTQEEPTNVNASVRVLSPGDNGPVSQTNDSTATAVAGADGGTATALPEATSTQTDPHNVNVSVRVGSAGDDAPITQVNNSTATAAPVAPSAIESAMVDLPAEGPNSYGDVENVAGIAQDLSQCPEDAACTVAAAPEANTTTPSASTALDQSTATATQDAPSNVSVSIRVASPGMNGDVTQVNSAAADGATSVTTATDPDNLVVAVEVPGDPSEVVISTDPNTPWTWNWNWTTGNAPTAPDATPFSTTEWNWDWTAPSDTTATQSEAAATAVPAPTPGHWTWTWIWTRGDGWTTTWTYDQPCSCTWSWVWTWNWPTPTPTTDSPTTTETLPAPPSDPQVVQTNESSAAAAALTTFDGQQTAIGASEDETALASQYQGITSDQTAVATADASQLRPTNFSWVAAGVVDKLAQTNQALVSASAAAFDTAVQTIDQNQVGTDDGALHSVAATQVIVTTQSAIATATTAQSDASNLNEIWSPTPWNRAQIGGITQTNEAVAGSYAAVAGHTTQIIGQTQIGGGADQLASALQAAVTTQDNEASAQVGQAIVRNRNNVKIPWNGIWNPPVDQSNTVSAASVSTSSSTISQTIVQEESGEGIAWDMDAQQTAIVKQGGAASASAGQANLENVARWNGRVASETPATAAPSTGAGRQTSTSPMPGRRIVTPTPTLPAPIGRPAGTTHSVGLLSPTQVTHWPRPLSLTPAGHTAAAKGATVSLPQASAPTAADQFRHILQNLLGAIASALGLLGATGFAALLAFFTLAAPGVRRLQAPVPALGRSADFARRERPG